MKILISHSDLDGCVARVLANYLKCNDFYDFSKFYHFDYKNEQVIYDTVVGDTSIKEIIFTDFSPSVELYKYCEKNRIRVQIFDHHATAFYKFCDGDGNLLIKNFVYDNNRCGSKIFYEDFFQKYVESSEYLDYFINLVNVYDLWKEDDLLWEEANNLQRVFTGMIDYRAVDKYYKFVNMQLQKMRVSKTFEFLPYEKGLIEYAINKENAILETARSLVEYRNDSSGIPYLYVQLTSKISFVAHNLLKDNPEYKYIVIRNLYTGGTEHSIRSKNEFDVKSIAEKWMGGGHLNASGVVLSEQMSDDLSVGKIHLN
jgi:oligoribonuclease NrnB/cAMP/cGMP phosphodiesterase (DHH superfamily)